MACMSGISIGSGQEYLRLAAAAWFVCFACTARAAGVDPLNIPDTQLDPVNWADLDGWRADDHAVAFGTFLASCKPLLAIERPRDPRPIADGLRCDRLAHVNGDKVEAACVGRARRRPKIV